ncbi:DUF3566 domain-containing protein [uncultured Friedmanniella sp.]|uniref:DUF3566 domain-containing protein n=1 Tax=uncultured Friedmanniella sp. TaxID=335381 RepID=UPI0035CB8368
MTTAAVTPGAAPTANKPSFWSRLTEGLGFEKKSDTTEPAADVAPHPAAAAGPVVAAASAAAPVTDLPAKGAPAKGAPAKGGSETAAPKPDSGLADTLTGPTALVPSLDPAPRGPQQYRVAQPTPQLRAPGAPLPVPVPGRPTPGAPGGATALVPEVLPGAPAPTRPATRRTRKARLRLSRLDPWSVMKTSFLFSIAAGIMLVVAVYGIWLVLSTSGLFGSVNDIIGILVSTPGDTTPFRVEDFVNTQRVMGVAALVATGDVLIFTALATLGSFLYNLAATMLGGLEITLAED